MIDRDLERNFQDAFVSATAARSRLITVEALLLELLKNPRVVAVLKALNCDLDVLRADLEDFIARFRSSPRRTRTRSPPSGSSA